MATYSPLPFVPQRFDQTAQKLSLAQMMYEAEMARINMEQQRRMQIGQTLASLGSLPGQFFDIKNTLDQQALLQQQRQQQIATEQDYRRGLVAAQEREDALRREAMEQADQRRQVEDVFRVGQATGRLSPEAFAALEGTPFVGAFGRVEQPMTTPVTPPAAATEGMMAPSARVPLAQMRYLPAMEAEAAEREKQQQAAMTFASIYEGASAAGYTPDESMMYAAKGQIPPPKPQSRAAEQYELRNVGPNVVQFQRDPTGRVIGQQIVAAAPEKPEPPAKPVPPSMLSKIVNTTAEDGSKDAVVNLYATMREDAGKIFVDRWAQLEQKAAEKNDWTDVAKYVTTPAIRSLPADDQRKVRGKVEAGMAISRTIGKLQELEQAGLLGKIPATYEKLYNFVGTTQDKRLAQAASELLAVMQEYRRNMTGVAFSDEERKEFGRILPDVNKNFEFNRALFEGLKTGVETTLRSYLEPAMGRKYMDYLITDINRQMMRNDRTVAPPMPPVPSPAPATMPNARPGANPFARPRG